VFALALLTFTGAVMLVRELTGRIEAAVVVGLLAAASPYLLVSQMARIQMLTCGWSFVALAGLHGFVRTGSPGRLAVFIAGWLLQMLSNVYLGIYLAVPVGVVLLHALASGAFRDRRRDLARLALGLAVCAVAVAPLAQTMSKAQSRYGVRRSVEETARYSADVASYASVWHEQSPAYLRSEIASDRALYPGGTLLLLALAGSARAAVRRRASLLAHPAAAYGGVALVAFLLSLGPAPARLGEPIGWTGPYQWLMDWVPGFDALRAPGRFAAHVLIALAVAAGFALSGLFEHLSRAARVGAIVVVAFLAAVEGERRFDWVAEVPPHPPGAAEAYRWLAAAPRGAVIELPIVAEYQARPRIAGASQTLFYQLATLQHGQRIVNGSSGFTPPLTAFLENATSPLAYASEAEAAAQLLQALDVRYVVVQIDAYAEHAREHAAALVDWFMHATSVVEEHRTFHDTHVFRLAGALGRLAPDPGTLVRLPRSGFAIHSTQPRDLERVMDGDIGTAWTAPQGRGTRLEITLARATEVAGITLRLAPHSLGDYPRGLRITGITPADARVVLFEGHGAVLLGTQLARDPASTDVPVTWASTRVIGLDVELTRSVEPWQWAVHEIDVWTGPPSAERSSDRDGPAHDDIHVERVSP
jgi:hypothetical protein